MGTASVSALTLVLIQVLVLCGHSYIPLFSTAKALLLIQLWPPCSECRKLFKLFNKSSLCTWANYALRLKCHLSLSCLFFLLSPTPMSVSFANYCSVHAPPAIKINFLSQTSTSPLSGQDIVKRTKHCYQLHSTWLIYLPASRTACAR